MSSSVTEDGLLGGRVRLLQPRDGYRAAVDPVLLAAAVPAMPGERVLDLGCGVGAAAFCLLARRPGIRVVGLEIQAELAGLAGRNAVLNGAAEGFRVVAGDAARPPEPLEGFDHVMTNPPFLGEGAGTRPADGSRALAHVEGGLDLAGWLKAAVKALRPKGRLTLIHRADRLAEILAILEKRGVGEVTVLPLWPKAGRAAGRVIVMARKAVRTPLRLLPGLVLHAPDGAYTPEAEAVLRGGAGLDPYMAAGDNAKP
jgi:tRNA1(Val) A37 N6-methylase TrmN6